MKCVTRLCFGLLFALFCAANAEDAERTLIDVIDNLDKENSVEVFGGLRIEKVENGREFPASPVENILDRVQRYIDSHQIEFTYPDEEDSETARAQRPAESRTRKLKKLLVPLMLLLKLKLAIIIPLMLKVIKVISLKALAASLLALVFSAASFFKDFMTKKKDHVTTAYITGVPLNADIVHSESWNRNGQASAQELAYNYHTIPQSSY